MMTNRGNYLYLFFFFLFSNFLSAQTITAVQSTDWSLASTWDLNRKPQISDTVVIDGYDVLLDESASVAAIRITNASSSGNSNLEFNSGSNAILEVSNDFLVTAEDTPYDVGVKVSGNDSIYVAGDLNYLRTTDNSNKKKLKLALDLTAKLFVQGNFIFDYGNSTANENGKDVDLHDEAELRVGGVTNIFIRGGDDLHFDLHQDSKINFEDNVNVTMTGGSNFDFEVRENGYTEIKGDFTITNSNSRTPAEPSTININVQNNGGNLKVLGDLNLLSTAENQTIVTTIDGMNSGLSVRGNINLDATSDGDVSINVEKSAKVQLGGNINRLSASNYGSISMDENSFWVYDGDKSQIIACTQIPASGTDLFDFSNMTFNNTSGAPMQFEGEVLINKELILDRGILETSPTALLVIASDAVIVGGSELAYVDGPIKKIGKTSAAGFTFPLGDEGTYAPLSISSVSDANAEYTAQYLSCPPPLSGSLHSSVVELSGTEHWEFDREESSPEVDVSLHWSDAGAQGINDLSDLIIARYNVDSLAWVSIGNGGTVDNGDGSGNIVNAISCPPPLSGSILAFGSRTGANALPVVLSAFEVRSYGQIVNVLWETTSEFNSDYFVVQRSSNGVNFEEINKVAAEKNSDQLTKYAVRDMNPEKGANYYRLCQVDIMGMKVYSRVLLVNNDSDTDFIVFPNPVKDVLQVRGDFEAKVYMLEFYDTSGRLISKKAAMAENGFLQVETKDLNLPQSGIYFMRLEHGKKQKAIPFIRE